MIQGITHLFRGNNYTLPHPNYNTIYTGASSATVLGSEEGERGPHTMKDGLAKMLSEKGYSHFREFTPVELSESQHIDIAQCSRIKVNL